MTTMSLAMIVKNEGTTIERVLACAKPLCDEMIVVDTGSTDDTVAKARAMGAQVHHFTWINDFAAARNHSFSLCTKEWILWLDGDDIITPENQARILEIKQQELTPELDGAFLRYFYPPFIQRRERIVRRALFGTQIEWREPIHECIHGLNQARMRYYDDVAIQHDTPPERHALKKDRNITILRTHVQNGANDQRTLYSYAVECLHSLYKDEAGPVVERFFATATDRNYRYEIYSKLYDFHMHFGEPQAALDTLFKGLMEMPQRAECYYKIGRHILDKQDMPHGALPMLKAASEIALPNDGIPETHAYTYGPSEALARLYFRLGDYGLAKKIAARALVFDFPSAPWMRALMALDPALPVETPLPEPWQEWTSGNIRNGVPPHVVIRILEENGYGPDQIVLAIHTALN